LNYVLITPAHNEAEYIELTLKSVVAQTKKPLKWIIVNDGSTDKTGQIVADYAADYSWIELLEMPKRTERHFGGKARAVNAGHERVSNLNFEILGNLDADVSFEPDYFEFLLDRFAERPRLGVAGTAFVEGALSYNYELVGIEHVSGMCQMFRRQCFEAIGGYKPLKSGGIDLIAVLSARAEGWETRTFVEKSFVHHRTQGGALHSGLRARWYAGRKDYLLGNHLVWEFLRSLYQMKYRPYVIGGFLVFISYVWHLMRRIERTIPTDLMALRQKEQLERLRALVKRRLHLGSPV